MNLNDYRALKSCATASSTGFGGGTAPSSKTVDLANRYSSRSIAMFTSKTLFDEHVPYMREYDDVGVLTIFMNLHFLAELRRQMSGEVTVVTTDFSPQEETFYSDYQLWMLGTDYSGELLQALEALDFWLMEELQEHTHPTVERSYTSTHKWMKLEARVE